MKGRNNKTVYQDLLQARGQAHCESKTIVRHQRADP